jgi:hypothetical protein
MVFFEYETNEALGGKEKCMKKKMVVSPKLTTIFSTRFFTGW